MTHHDLPRDTPPPVDRSLKVPHLVFGLLFLGIAGIWAVGESGAIGVKNLAVLAPAVLIMAGVIGLAASLASGRNRRRAHQDDYAAFVDERPEETYPAAYDTPQYDTPQYDTPENDVAENDDDSFGDTAPITEEK